MGRIYKRGKVFWIDYIDYAGLRIREGVGPVRSTALAVLHERERKTHLRREKLIPAIGVDAKVEDVKAKYLKAKKIDLRPGAVKRIQGALDKILEYLNPVTVEDITPAAVDDYRAYRLESVSKRTVNIETQTLKSMLKWAKPKIIGANPLADYDSLKIKDEDKRHRRFLQEKETAALLDASPEPFKTIWEAFIFTGMRKGELESLQWRDVDLQEREIKLRPENTKSGTSRVIPIFSELYEDLLRLKKSAASEFVFVNRDGRPWKNNLLKRFKTCVKRAELDFDGVDLHSLRYTFVSQLLRHGANIKAVQDLAGHKSVQTTLDIYAQVCTEDLRVAIDIFETFSLIGKKEGTLKAQSRKGAVQRIVS